MTEKISLNEKYASQDVSPPLASWVDSSAFQRAISFLQSRDTTREGHSTRIDPSDNLPSNLHFKYISQLGRLSELVDLRTRLATKPPEETTPVALSVALSKVEDIHKGFCMAHSYMESSWPLSCADHDYFKEDIRTHESKLVTIIRTELLELQEELENKKKKSELKNEETARAKTKVQGGLLPEFTGDCLEWPSFSELFTSLIIRNPRLSDIQRLHYLRDSVKNEAAELVEDFPLTGDSFKLAWDKLHEHYHGKCVLIRDQLNKYFALQAENAPNGSKTKSNTTTGVTKKSPKPKSQKAGTSGQPNVTKGLKKVLPRESRMSPYEDSSDYPPVKRTKTQKLKQIDPVASGSSVKNLSFKAKSSLPEGGHRSTYQVPQQSMQPPPHYPCDCCDGDHFIVMCPEFRNMSVPDRWGMVELRSLCYNCCGRHSAKSCRSLQLCKYCDGHHHTMLHKRLNLLYSIS